MLASYQTTSSPAPTTYQSPVPTIDPTANWKTDLDTNSFKQGDVVSVYAIVQHDTKVSDQHFLFTVATPVQTTLGLRDWIDKENILVPYPGEEAPKLGKDAILGGEPAIRINNCGEGCFTLLYVKHSDKIYAVVYPSGDLIPENIQKTFDQILSTFRFLK